MFAYIIGDITQIGENYIFLECNNIGYMVYVSDKCLDFLGDQRDSVKIYTHLHVREDDVSLYGFYSLEELDTFKILIGISGIGPKVAMNVLSCMSINELKLAVITENAKAIQAVNGIGNKGAQRIVLELKDKLKMEDMISEAYNDSLGINIISSDTEKDVIKALVSLGYSNGEAKSAINKVPDKNNLSEEELLKAALKYIF